MKTTLDIKNFRIFDEKGVEFKLEPITFLTGCNSSGKSSLVKAILFLQSYLKQILDDHKAGKEIRLEDYKVNFSTYPLNSLGGFSKVVNRKSDNRSITIEYTTYSKMLSREVMVSMTFDSPESDYMNNAYLASLTVSLDGTVFFSTSRDSVISCNLNPIKALAKEFVILEELLNREEYMDDVREYDVEEYETIKTELSKFNQKRKDDVDASRLHEKKTSRRLTDIDWQLTNESIFHLSLIDQCEGKSKSATIDYLGELSSELQDYEKGALKRLILLFSKSEHDTLKSFWLEYERKFLITQKGNGKFDSVWSIGDSVQTGLSTNIDLEIPQPYLLHREDDPEYLHRDYVDSLERIDKMIDVYDNEVSFNISDYTDEIMQATEIVNAMKFVSESPEILDFKFIYSVLTHLDCLNQIHYDWDGSSLIEKIPNNWGGDSCCYDYYYFKEWYRDTWDGMFYHYMAEAVEQFVGRLITEVLTPEWADTISYVSSSRIDVQRLYPLDKQDDFTKLINRYFEAKKQHAEQSQPAEYEVGDFVKKWCQKLGMGDNIELSLLPDGIGAQVKVFDSENPDGNLLSYEGYGYTQLMSILLQIETEILSNRKGTIIIEEPEIHLHPRLQSLLTDMFYEAYKEYGIHFIIETHSEYMIRKSQLLVKQMNFEANDELEEISPFRTYYIPVNGATPYSLLYRTDGVFANDFGEGFFDEAEKLAFQIL